MKSTAGMTQARSSRDDRLDLVFGALSDRTRRALLARLERSPAMVTELAEPFDMSLPAVSKHLRVLERAGLVRRTIDGRVHTCALDPGPLEEADRWMVRYRALWEDALDRLARFVEKDAAR
jgi:DNA-binding transcriptional ArsR family regulator